MKLKKLLTLFFVSTLQFSTYLLPAYAEKAHAEKSKIFVVSSYHREYLWSQDTNKGVVAALLKFGFLDNEEQGEAFTRNDTVTSSMAVIKKAWMDTKRKNSEEQMAASTLIIVKEIDAFQPDLILLGDDNATNLIGNQYLDTEIPIVFWGVNGFPLKYGLLDSLEHPGHNVTGVYQAGYLKECLEFLKRISPDIKTMAVLSDDSPTGRSKSKELENLSRSGELPVKLIESVTTNSEAEWKSSALRLQKEVDVFFVLNHNSVKNSSGESIDQLDLGAWYLRNIKRPECAQERQFAVEGLLAIADDSGYNQGFLAVTLANDILNLKTPPSDISVKAPPRGPYIVNRARARMLGIKLDKARMGYEEVIETALALEEEPAT